MTERRFLEILDIMISWGMLDKSRLLDEEYDVKDVDIKKNHLTLLYENL